MNECSVNLPVLLTGQYRITPSKSKGFQSLIRGIGDSKTKHEEDKVIRQEIIHLKQHLVSTHLTSKQTRELLIRLMYCEMLGHNVSFGYIHAIKFAQQSTLLEKRTGYLAASIFLRKDHQLVVLLINTLQKDLKSTNVVAKSAALNVFCKLIDAEMITALLPLIFQALKDKRVEIRKKALMALQRVHTINDTLLPNIGEQLSNAILDRDPAVVSASLHLFYDVIKKSPVNYRMYLKAFLQVLRQIMEGNLSEYNFHGVQAPWIQIKLLKILALLGRQQKSISENMSAVLLQMVNTLPTDCNIGCGLYMQDAGNYCDGFSDCLFNFVYTSQSVMFECIQTISTIYPLQSLLDIASRKTGLFLTSNSSDLKCLGITAMTALVELDLCYAADPKQQQIIIDCLDDDDLTMRKKTLDLLYKITNSENVALVCAKLLNYLRSTTEQYIKKEVVSNVTKLAEKYAPDSTWYIETINDVIQAGDGFIRPDVVHALMKLIAAGEDDVKTFVVSRYIDLIRKKTLPDLLVQISCWVIGEYGYLVQDSDSLQDIVGQLTVLLDRKFTDPTTCGWIVTAVAKLTARIGRYLPETRGIIDRYRTGFPAELRQRCHEINILAADMSTMECAFPVDSSKEDIKVCPTLSFLDDYVSKAYCAGARHYQPHIKNNQQTQIDEPDKPKFITKPYENPFMTKTFGKEDNPEQEKQSIPVKSSLTNVTPKETVVIPKKRASVHGKVSEPQPTPVWGPSGYSGNKIKKQSNEQSKSLQTNTAELSSKNSSNSSEESSNTTTEVEKIVVIRSKQSLSSAFFSGVGQSKSTPSPSIEASGDFNQPTTQTIIEPCTTDIPLMNTPCDISQTQNEDSESDLNESLEELHLADKQVALLSEATLESNVLDVSRLGEVNSLTLDQDELEIDTDNDMPKTTTEMDLLVDLDSEVVEKPLISISGFDSERMQDATAFDQNDEIGSREKCLTSEFDTNLKEKEATSSNESNSLLEEDLLSATNALHRQRDHFTELCSDSNVRLVYCTVHKPLELILSLKLTNQCQARTSLENVSMTIEPPSNLVAEGSSNKITVDMLAFLDTVTQATLLTCHYPAAHMVLKGSLRYTISRTPKVLYFNQEITCKELLRPLKLSTEEFGERWTSTSNGVKQIVSGTSAQSCEQMITIIANHMNFAVVDIIGCEGIAAGTLLGRDICLLHCNFVKDVEVWIKSSSKLLSEITMQECVSYLQKL